MITGVGEVVVKASQQGDDDFIPAEEVVKSFTVAKANQSTNFAIGSLTYGQAPVTINTTPGETANEVVYTIVSGPATVSGTVVTITGAGTLVVKATQEGSQNYNAAEVIKEFSIAKAAQTISFTSPSNKTFGDPAFDLTATGSGSGNPITFAIMSGPATVVNNTVTITGAGTIVVKASQAGNENYLGASVEQTFCSNPVKPVTTIAGLDTENPVLTSSATDGNQWFNNGTAINGATAQTYTATEPGVYTVVTSASTCTSAVSDAQVLIITGLETTPELRVRTYPNPVVNELIIDMHAINPKREATIALYDIAGRTMLTTKGKGTVVLPMATYNPGRYTVVVNFGQQRIAKHIIKK